MLIQGKEKFFGVKRSINRQLVKYNVKDVGRGDDCYCVTGSFLLSVGFPIKKTLQVCLLCFCLWQIDMMNIRTKILRGLYRVLDLASSHRILS